MGEDVGILAMEVYFPTQYVDQNELEKYDGVSEGKYTKGLGQQRMGFCADCEDAISMALTVTKRLLEQNKISPAQVGRLEVGTESGIDRSKSVKSYLMQLFGDNHDVGGLDTVQACFGGTQALFNAVDWLTSAAWDGRFAVVVASDVATYPPGPARPTGGAGAVAMLLGPNAPLVFEPRLRAFYTAHVYDFYKPNPFSEYPVVDGLLSINSYLTAVVSCYETYSKKMASLLKNQNFGLKDVCGVLFHSPYTKLVEKAFSRLVQCDVTRGFEKGLLTDEETAAVKKLTEGANGQPPAAQPPPELVAASRRAFGKLGTPGLGLAREIGNMYTASLHASLASFLAACHDEGRQISSPSAAEPRLLLFSYGSGLAAAMYSIRLKTTSPLFAHLCEKLSIDIKTRMSRRRRAAPAEMVESLEKRHENFGKVPIDTHAHDTDISANLIEGGAFVLEKIDEKFRRTYAYMPPSTTSSPVPSPLPVSKAQISCNGGGDILLNGLHLAVDGSPFKNGYQHAD